MKQYRFLILILLFNSCKTIAQEKVRSNFQFNSSHKELESAVSWAKDKALSFAHDDSDAVGYWYEAALPNREAFCMRDVSHQSIGADILGLSQHNFNMILKFCSNISESKNYASYWEINRYDKPAPVDYENDQDFWYNLPANFDLVYSIRRLHKWTGNQDYLNNPLIQKFSSLSLNEYVNQWELSSNKVVNRNRSLFVQNKVHFPDNRFGNKRGIPTYYERGSIESLLGIDMTASFIAALQAYIEMLQKMGKIQEAEKYKEVYLKELDFLRSFWWDSSKQAYKSILYEDNTFDYFMMGEDEAFLHFLLYFDVLTDLKQIQDIMDWYEGNQHKLIVELKSYLPILFYENNFSQDANRMIVALCDKSNPRRDYPEISYTIIEHITRGLMGIDTDEKHVETFSRLEEKQEWASVNGVSIRGTEIGVKHYGKNKTYFENQGESKLLWKVKFEGDYDFIEVNGNKNKAEKELYRGKNISFAVVPVPGREKAMASVTD